MSVLQPEVSSDKLCATRKSTMSEHAKNRWQKRRRHDAHDSGISGTFCGRKFKDIRTMVLIPAAVALDVSRNTVRKYL